jgi:hypothetical protein
MRTLLDYPFLVLVLSLALFWLAAWLGSAFRTRQSAGEKHHEDFSFVLGAALTLLGLIIGFTFSMAVSRYDQRKNLEEAEANAIGTEYLRADLLSNSDAAELRGLLKNYLDQRILFYTDQSQEKLRQIDDQTAKLQTALWEAVKKGAASDDSSLEALVVSGMNDVLNSQGYTQAAWWNRLPLAAWFLVVSISVFCNLLLGYGAQVRSSLIFLILPIALSVSLFLIADIDSPRRGVIRVVPQNLESLAHSLKTQ